MVRTATRTVPAGNGELNDAASLWIGSGSAYVLGGGTLQVNGTLTNSGDFTKQHGRLRRQFDRRPFHWRYQNLGSMNVAVDANSLLIVPAGFNTATNFASFACLGVTHTVGTTLVVPAGQGFAGSVSINDPVNCQGSIAAGSGAINLNNGLLVSGTGNVTLGYGNLTINDTNSGMNGGGTLTLGFIEQGNGSETVGTSGSAAFTQSGGMNTINVYVASTALPWHTFRQPRDVHARRNRPAYCPGQRLWRVRDRGQLRQRHFQSDGRCQRCQ